MSGDGSENKGRLDSVDPGFSKGPNELDGLENAHAEQIAEVTGRETPTKTLESEHGPTGGPTNPAEYDISPGKIREEMASEYPFNRDDNTVTGKDGLPHTKISRINE